MKLSLRYSLLVGAILGCAARCAATAPSEEVLTSSSELTFSEEFTQISEARDQLEEAVKLRNDASLATLAALSKVEALKRMVADKQRILHEVTNEVPNKGTIEAACQETAKDPIDACADYMASNERLKVAEQEASTAIDKERACKPAVEAAYRNVIAKIELIKEWAALIAGNEVVERYEARLVKGECCKVEENELEVGNSVDGAVQGKESCCKGSNGKEADESAEQEKEEKEKKGKKGKKDKDEKEDKDKKDKKDKSEKKKGKHGKARLSSDEDKAADHESETKDPKDLAEASTVAPVLKEETGKDTVAPVIKEETGESALEQKVEKDNSLDNVVADQDSMASFNKPTLVGILSLVSVALFY